MVLSPSCSMSRYATTTGRRKRLTALLICQLSMGLSVLVCGETSTSMLSAFAMRARSLFLMVLSMRSSCSEERFISSVLRKQKWRGRIFCQACSCRKVL